MEPKFDREIKTRPLDEDDYEILKGSVKHVDEHGREYVPTLAELNATGMSRVKRKGLALRVAFGCAVRAFCKVYANVQTMNLHKGDTIKVAYTLEINR